MKKNILLFSLLALVIGSCTKDGCYVNKLCTEEYRLVAVKIVGDTDDMETLIDSSRTIRASNDVVVFKAVDYFSTYSTILTDTYVSSIERKGELFIFEAFKDGQKVVSEEYVIKHDCCHIIKVSGKDSINL